MVDVPQQLFHPKMSTIIIQATRVLGRPKQSASLSIGFSLRAKIDDHEPAGDACQNEPQRGPIDVFHFVLLRKRELFILYNSSPDIAPKRCRCSGYKTIHSFRGHNV